MVSGVVNHSSPVANKPAAPAAQPVREEVKGPHYEENGYQAAPPQLLPCSIRLNQADQREGKQWISKASLNVKVAEKCPGELVAEGRNLTVFGDHGDPGRPALPPRRPD